MKDKQLQKLVEKLIVLSFDSKGNMIEEKVQKCVKILKQLPATKSIMALEAYLKGVKREAEKTLLQIWSATPLTSGQVDEILKQIKGNFPVTEVRAEVEPSLLGGLRVKLADVVYDDSVGKKIVKLQEAIRD